MAATAFETHCGRGASKKWKDSIRCVHLHFTRFVCVGRDETGLIVPDDNDDGVLFSLVINMLAGC